MNLTFLSDQTVSAADLNAIAEDFGVEFSEYEDGATYAVDSLNAITAAIVTAGVSINGFAPSITDGAISVGSGIAFFADGFKFRLEEAVSMTTEVTDGYLYLQKNDDKTVELLATETEPPEGAILIALLTDGAIDDRRTYATMKGDGIGGNAYQKVLPIYHDVVEALFQGWQPLAEIHPAFTNPQYIIRDDRSVLTLPEDGESCYYPSLNTVASGTDYEKYYVENGIIKIAYRYVSGKTPYSGYLELR